LEETEELEQLRVLFSGYKIKVSEVGEAAPSVDTKHDIESVFQFMKRTKDPRYTP